MPKPVDLVRAECAKRKISIAQFERDCGFGNGYFNPKKLNRISYDRAVIISEKLDLPLSVLIGAEEQKENPTAAKGSEVLEGAGYYKLNKENKKLIDQMIAQLIKSQSGD